MRLKEFEIIAIREVFKDIFKQGEIYLFGSRVDDKKKGGDIDLYIKTQESSQLTVKKIDFLVMLKKMIGVQKIDLVIDRGADRLIDKVAIEEGILLWKS